MNWRQTLLMLATALLSLPLFSAETRTKPVFELTVNRPDGIFSPGEEIVFTAQLLEDGRPATGYRVDYTFVMDKTGEESGTFQVSDTPFVFRTSRDTPGWCWIKFVARDSEGKEVELYDPRIRRNVKFSAIGAMVDPLKIKAPVGPPEDFDAFWDQRRRLLDMTPWQATRTEVEMPEQFREYADKLRVYDITVDCPGSRPVRAVLTVPRDARDGEMPVIVNFHSYGVFSARPMIYFALRGAVMLDVNAHGIDNFQSDEYYAQLRSGELRNYVARGVKTPETYYFHDMYLRAMRAMDYAKSLPEWDGRRLIVTGGSQGGAQAIFAIAMTPEVTLGMVDVPAMLDHQGALATPPRTPGWPRLNLALKSDGTLPNPEAARTLSYFDGVNLAGRIKCDMYLCTGWVDQSCSPCSVYAFFNALPGTNKLITTHPEGGHGATTNGNRPGVARIEEYIKPNQEEK